MESGLSGIEIVAFIASIASLILAVGAIWLSIVFFRMSNEASQATTEAAKGIDASVKRLENLFDKLYSDTFSMMKDTVSDMRKHIWNGDSDDSDESRTKNDILEEADKKAEEKIAEIKSSVDKQLSEILSRQKASDGKVKDIGSEIEKLLENVIETSRFVETEAREETVRNHILMELRKARRRKGYISASELVDRLSENIPPHRIVREIASMREDGLLFFDGEGVEPDSRIRLPRVIRGNSEEPVS